MFSSGSLLSSDSSELFSAGVSGPAATVRACSAHPRRQCVVKSFKY